MGNTAVYLSLKSLTEKYRERLEHYQDAQFCQTPPQGGWSYSEVYSHIFTLSAGALQETENCILGKGKAHGSLLVARLILFFGSFPPGFKYKVPKRLEAAAQKVSRETAAALIRKFLELLETVYPQLEGADPAVRTAHPRLGYLNARQWFRFTEIHLKHHLKQLDRLEKSF